MQMLITTAIMLLPILVAVIVAWFAGRGLDMKKSFKTGAWVTVVMSVLYYSFLALLAAVNAVNDAEPIGSILLVIILVAAVALPTLVCLGGYTVFARAFRKLDGR